jgi:hypothetical protein
MRPTRVSCSLEACIEDVKARNGWLADDALRLIFHVFKPLKDTEAQAVKALVEKLTGQYASVEFAFVHVSDEHDWAIFDQRCPVSANLVQPQRPDLLRTRFSEIGGTRLSH